MISKFRKFSDEIKDFLNTLGVQTRLILLTIIGVSFLVTFFAFFIIINIQSNIDKQVILLDNHLKVAQSISNTCGVIQKSQYDKNHISNEFKKIIDEYLTKHKDISYAVITDNSGFILAKSTYADLYLSDNKSFILPPKQIPYIKRIYLKNGKILVIAEPIQIDSTLYGWVWVGIPDIGFTIVGSNKELLIFLLEIFTIVWLLSIIGAIINSLIIIRPLKKLEKSAKAISEGRFGFQLPLHGFLGKELTELVLAFNKMSKRLHQYEESNLAILSSERNKFESVLMSIADGVIVCNKDDIIQIINPATARLLDRSSDELIGQKISAIWDIKTNSYLGEYLNNFKNGLSEDTSEYAKYELSKNGRNLILLITPLYNNDDKQLGSVTVIQDRTKETEVELIKQEFISNVSHELRTPITSIKCYVDTLCSHESDIDEATRNEFLSTINEETDRLSKLVNDVLELSRLDSPTGKLELKLDSLYPPIDFALKAIQVLANKKSIKLLTDIEENLPELNINAENLERILINLLSNAIKYTPGNGIVKLLVKQSESNVVFQIVDNGIGISTDQLPLIFDRFYRVENKVHTIKGTGLGLTIVKKSVEQHKGEIYAQSKLGEGTLFEFYIPIPTYYDDIEDIIFAKSA